jgi:nucleoside triphosphate pyrophosphatase
VRLVLASASPRRRALLDRLGVPFVVLPSHIPEAHPEGPADRAMIAVALAKARATAAALADPGRRPPGLPGPPLAVLGADTEVVLDGQLMGKPRDDCHAREMLRALRGRTHEVITAVALVSVPAEGAPPWPEETAAVLTQVLMSAYSDEDIDRYVASGEPLDKAGAYAVQGLGGRLVARVDGCMTNVVGLPVETTRRLLERAGLPGIT